PTKTRVASDVSGLVVVLNEAAHANLWIECERELVLPQTLHEISLSQMTEIIEHRNRRLYPRIWRVPLEICCPFLQLARIKRPQPVSSHELPATMLAALQHDSDSPR